jgi:hypothetical protein
MSKATMPLNPADHAKLTNELSQLSQLENDLPRLIRSARETEAISKAAAQNAVGNNTSLSATTSPPPTTLQTPSAGGGCDDPRVLTKINEAREATFPILAAMVFGPTGEIPKGSEREYQSIIDIFHKVTRTLRDVQEKAYDPKTGVRICFARYIVDSDSLPEHDQEILASVAQTANMVGVIAPDLNTKYAPLFQRVCQAGPVFYKLYSSSGQFVMRWDCERYYQGSDGRPMQHHPNLQEFMASQ